MATTKALTKEQATKKELFQEHLKHKKAEDAAKQKRYEVEEKIKKLYGSFDEKSKTFNEPELGFSINIKKNIVFNLNQEKYKLIRLDIPEELRPEKIKFDLDTEGYKYLKENEKDIYKKISECVDKKENKSTVSVEKK